MAELIVPNNASSVEIGTPGKNGVLKVYFNPKNRKMAMNEINNALVLYQYIRDEYRKLNEVNEL